MPLSKAQFERSTRLAWYSGERKRGSFDVLRAGHKTRAALFFLLCWLCAELVGSAQAQTISFSQGAGALSFTGGASPYSTTWGANGLGIAPAAGFIATAVSGGYFYYTPYTIVLTGANAGHPAVVAAYISSNFANPTTEIQLRSCAYPGPCNTVASYTNMPLTQGTEVVVLPQQTSNGSFVAYLGLYVANANGGITSSDLAKIKFDVIDSAHGTTTVQLNLTVSVQTAVELRLAKAASGQTMTFNSDTANPNYSTDFGSVNGLGINPGPNLTVVSGQVANGSLYATPYLLKPQFSGFSSTSNTNVTAYVSTNFAHSTILKLYDSGTSNSGYSAISTNSGSPSTLTSSVTNGTDITRYLGLYVSNANGAGTFTGTDSATLTYTITVN
jgi:hypothetical protein